MITHRTCHILFQMIIFLKKAIFSFDRESFYRYHIQKRIVKRSCPIMDLKSVEYTDNE